MYIVEYIQSLLLIISAIFIIIAAIGMVTLNNNKKNVVYARIHIVGIFDMAVILALIGLGQYLLAGIYFVLVPFTSHAIGYAYYRSEDTSNNEELDEPEKEDEATENPFIYSKEEVIKLNQTDLVMDSGDDVLGLSTLEISEDE